MKTIFKALILALLIFILFISIGFIKDVLIDSKKVGEFFNGLYYLFFYGFWAFWLFSFVYIYVIKKNKYRKHKYIKALMLSSTGYLISRIPDIIDSHFFVKFKWSGFLVFFLFVPLLVELEILVSKWQSRK